MNDEAEDRNAALGATGSATLAPEYRCVMLKRGGDGQRIVLKWALLGVVSVMVMGLLVAAFRAWGPYSVGFSFAVVWLPMTWLGTASRVVLLRLPKRIHPLRAFERDGRCYERIGVRAIKRLLRRGPLSVFNPGLHLPSERSPERLVALERRMREAEASHGYLFAFTLLLVLNAALQGFWSAAGWTLLFNVLVNGFPVLLQRYNRALLVQRFGTLARFDP